MQLFINLTEDKVFTRKKSRGYKKLEVLTDANKAVVKSNKDVLEIHEEEQESKELTYLILCNDFGILGREKGISKIKVIFLDNGYMLVTLLDGVLIGMKDGLEMYTTKETVPQIQEYYNGRTNIFWVDTNLLQAVVVKENLLYDKEYVFEIQGEVDEDGKEYFDIEHLADEDVDLSLGAIAKDSLKEKDLDLEDKESEEDSEEEPEDSELEEEDSEEDTEEDSEDSEEEKSEEIDENLKDIL